MVRSKEIFTPAARAKITHIVYERGVWIGRRGGIACKLKFRQPTLSGERVLWRARIGGAWKSGEAGTVTQALEAIEREAARKDGDDGSERA